ncbi:MAG: hypothetical protein JXR07_11015 [Reichenbachiella sp.]
MVVLKRISLLVIVLILLLPILTLTAVISSDDMKLYMLIGSVIWFVLAPFWIKNE